MVEVVSAAAGRVIAAGKEILPGYDDRPVQARYDVVYLLDERGWYHRYSHLQLIDAAVRPGAQIGLGQKVGVLGKEGGSGGWSHLHYDITSRQPSGLWGIQEGYAFLWEAYQRQYAPKIMAVARPPHLFVTGGKRGLDRSKTWSTPGEIARYDEEFNAGPPATRAIIWCAWSEPMSTGRGRSVICTCRSRRKVAARASECADAHPKTFEFEMEPRIKHGWNTDLERDQLDHQQLGWVRSWFIGGWIRINDKETVDLDGLIHRITKVLRDVNDIVKESNRSIALGISSGNTLSA